MTIFTGALRHSFTMHRRHFALLLVLLASLCRMASAHPGTHTEDFPETESEILYMHEHAKSFCYLSQYSNDRAYLIDHSTETCPLKIVNTAPAGEKPSAYVTLSWSYYQNHPLRMSDFTVVVFKNSSVSYRDGAEDTFGSLIDSVQDGMSGSIEYQVIYDPTGTVVESHSGFWNFDPNAEECKDCECKVRANLGSIDLEIPLGRTGYGATGNDLVFYSEELANLGRGNLRFRGVYGSAGSTVSSSGGFVSSVQTGNSLATVTPTPDVHDPNAFTIYFTYVNDPRPSPPSPVYREVDVRMVDAGIDGERLTVTETIGEKTSTYAYTQPSPGKWVFIESDTRKTTKEKNSDDGSDRTFSYYVEEKAPDGTWKLVSRENRWEHHYTWGWEVVERVTDPGGAAFTSNYSFYYQSGEDPGVNPSYGKVQQEVLPTGQVRNHTYADLDEGNPEPTRVETITENYAGVSEGKVTTISRSVVGGMNIVVEEVQVLGNSVSKKETIAGSNARTEKVYPSDGGSPLITTTSFVSGGIETILPDGTCEKTVTSVSSGMLTRSTFKGVKNPGTGHYLIKGSEKVELVAPSGVVKQTTEYGIEGGVRFRIEGRITADEDERERPERVDVYHGDATSPTYSEYSVYDCCGQSQFTGRDGVTTHYFYDAIGRVWKNNRNGISEETIRDGATEKLHRFPEAVATASSGASASNLLSSKTRDLADNVVAWQMRSPKDGTLLTTTRAISVDLTGGIGKRMVWTLPSTTDDMGVSPQIIEDYYPDERIKSRSGPLVEQERFDYGATATGLVETRSLVDSNGDPFGAEVLQFDWAGRKSSLTFAGDANGDEDPDQTGFTYDLSGRLAKIIDPDGVSTLFSEDPATGTLTAAMDRNGNGSIDPLIDMLSITRKGVGLDSAGKVILWEESRARETNDQGQSFEKLVSREEKRTDGLRNVSSLLGPGQAAATSVETVTYLSGQAGGWDVTNTRPDGTYTVEKIRGGLSTEVGEYNSVGQLRYSRIFSHDDYQRVTGIADSRGPSTTFDYVSPLVDLIVRTTVGSDVTEITYDERSRRTSFDRPDTLDSSGATVSNTRVFSHWPSGMLREESGTPGYRSTYAYDEALRLRTQVTYGDSTTTTRWEYDPDRGWLTAKRYDSSADGQGSGESYTYTAGGRVKTRTLARGVVGTRAYDAAGDLESITYSDGTPSLQVLERDQMGRIRHISDASGERAVRYDGWGEMATDSYLAGSELAGWQVIQDRDATGRLSGLRTGMSGTGISEHAIGYGYDSAGRVETVSSGEKNASYVYHPTHQMLQQVAIWDGNSQVLYGTMQYDSLQRLRRVAYHNGQTGGSLQVFSDSIYGRDAEGKVSSLTARDGSKEVYGYNPAGELVSSKRLVSAGGSAYLAGQNFQWSYDGIGNRLSMGRGGDSSATGLRQTTYDPQPLNLYSSALNPGAVDVVGNAANSATVTVDGSTASRQGDYFHREVTVDNSTGPAWKSVAVTDGTDSETGAIEVPPANQAFTYDADGNLKTDGIREYFWDGENRLIKVATLTSAVLKGIPYEREEHVYDADWRRVKTEVFDQPAATTPVDTIRYLWAGWRCLGEMGAADFLKKRFVWGLDQWQQLHLGDGSGALLWTDDIVSGETHFSHFDGNGNVVGLSNAGGGRTAEYRYTPFGELVTRRGAYADSNSHRFSTKPAERTKSLYYYGYRSYDSANGRWLSRDPLGEVGGANLSGFVLNDPVNRFDDLGLSFDWKLPEYIQKSTGPLVESIDKMVEMVDWGLAAVASPFSSSDEALLLLKVEQARAARFARLLKTPCRGRFCFPAGTQVLMADGSTKSIESVKEGDRVLADEPGDDVPPAASRVTALHHNWTEWLIHIEIDGDDDGTGDGLVKATGQHPFWTQNRGWVRARDLIGGDLLRDRDGKEARVVAAEENPEVAETYNLSVQDAHTFFVLAGDVPVLVHNTNPGPRLFIVYQGIMSDGSIYTGRASMPYREGATSLDVLRYRYGNRPPFTGFSIPHILLGDGRGSLAYLAIRGAEHLYYQRVLDDKNLRVANKIRPAQAKKLDDLVKAARELGAVPCPR